MPTPVEIYQRNLPYVGSQGPYRTELSPTEEMAFIDWAQKNKVPVDNTPTSDYDMRGFYKGLINGDPNARSGMNPNDKRLHFSDYWKTPYHQSFSAESQFANPKVAPTWNEKDQLVLPDGTVVFDERASKK